MKSVTLVDLDPDMTNLFKTHKTLVGLNQGSLNSPKVKIINADGFVWLKENKRTFDFIVVDFPDPSSFSSGKLYTNTFYRLLQQGAE